MDNEITIDSKSNVDAIKSLYVYDGVTLLNNNENTVMKVMYKSK